MIKKNHSSCWLFPILYFFMVWMTMAAPNEGTDFANQIFMLESVQKMPLIFIFNENGPFLYFLVYKVLYSIIDISPRFYIALLAFIYFSIILLMVEKMANHYNVLRLNRKSLSYLAIFTCLCYSPLYICIARFHFAVLLVIVGVLLFILKKNKLWKILGILITFLAYYAHEGIMIIYAIILLSYFLQKFWLDSIMGHNLILRNIVVCSISITLVVFGPLLFTSITSIMGNYNLINERYTESYVGASAGDGVYLLVLVLSLFGSILTLFITSLYDRRNNWITAFCISGLFIMCLFYNQKFFFVQRIFMFMPLFIGLSCMQVLEDLKPSSKRLFFNFLLFSVPLIYLCQLVIQRGIFFGLL